jgi:hypothetical protein
VAQSVDMRADLNHRPPTKWIARGIERNIVGPRTPLSSVRRGGGSSWAPVGTLTLLGRMCGCFPLSSTLPEVARRRVRAGAAGIVLDAKGETSIPWAEIDSSVGATAAAT